VLGIEPRFERARSPRAVVDRHFLTIAAIDADIDRRTRTGPTATHLDQVEIHRVKFRFDKRLQSIAHAI